MKISSCIIALLLLIGPGIDAARASRQPPNNVQALITKGAELWATLQSELENEQHRDVPSVDLSGYYSWSPAMRVEPSSVYSSNLFPALHIPYQPGTFKEQTVSGVRFRGSSEYDNLFSPAQGIIIAVGNFKGEGDPTRWSDFIYTSWKQMLSSSSSSGGGRGGGNNNNHAAAEPPLKWVFRDNIINPDTQDVCNWILASHGETVASPTRHEFWPDDDEFFALLATDNAKGIAFLLHDHRDGMGHRNIRSIGFQMINHNYYMWLALEPYRPVAVPHAPNLASSGSSRVEAGGRGGSQVAVKSQKKCLPGRGCITMK